MASNRYITIVAMLDDPLNRAVIERELLRRSRKGAFKWLPPPTPAVGGGFVFPTLREWQKTPREISSLEEAEATDSLALVFNGSGEHSESYTLPLWHVLLPDGTEIGPFDQAQEAKQQAIALLVEQGWRFFETAPWDEQDTTDYPL